MNKQVKISIFGAHINNANLGCQALTYSLLSLLDSISKKTGIKFHYYIFEYTPNDDCIKKMCNLISISRDVISCHPILPIFSPKSYVKHFRRNIKMIKIIKSCDLAIDLTAGDSFSDIYGDQRYRALTYTKRMVQLLRVPLVLGPQTYGPFLKPKNASLAKKVFKKCRYIIARDKISAELASKLSGQTISYTTDLAFRLPYKKRNNQNNKIQVGFNISGLLVSNHIEKGIENTIKLKTSYDNYVESVLEFLCNNESIEVILLAHVEEDIYACKKYHNTFPTTKIAPLFDNPIDVKSYISGFDIFIGARMHATIAAFTAGVATIPTAYSRKFKGLFEVVDYNRIIDLQKYSTEEAILQTINCVSHYRDIKNEVKDSLRVIQKYNDISEKFFINAINNTMQFSSEEQ